MNTHNFTYNDDFYLDGKKFQIISGAIHYFRIVPQYWQDRLEKLKAMGCNTVETYIPWNLHEEKKGNFKFDGILDIEHFVHLAQDLGLYVILRPSPYICAEWEFGGLPAWLLAEHGMRVRCSYEPFLKHVEEYYDELFKHISPLQVNHGGPVILMQIENEYGYFGTDKAYINAIKDMMVERGVVVPMITSDGPFEESLSCGHIDNILSTGNFGSHTNERFQILKDFQSNSPLMCAEYWLGWFDTWGAKTHSTGNLEQICIDYEAMLEQGHANFYMFEGGTNFGFMSGANYYDELTPDVTSYDYDAVLTEDGQITEKYRRLKEINAKHTSIPEVSFSTNIIKKDYGTLQLTNKVSLFSVLNDISTPVSKAYPVSMEQLGQNYGYTLYRSNLTYEKTFEKIRLWKANDRANIFIDESLNKILYDRELLEEHEVSATIQANSQIDILMENMGRVNFGPRMDEQRKGIDGGIQINGHLHHDWEMYTLPLDNIDKVDFSKDYKENAPAFYQFTFEVDEIGDTFLDFEGWGKGCAFVNGFNIGRFWEIGPQKRLYIPGPLLNIGTNEIILFETDGKCSDHISLKNEPDLG